MRIYHKIMKQLNNLYKNMLNLVLWNYNLKLIFNN